MDILALDVGTSSVKAAVLDVATGRPAAPPVHVPYELDHPTPDAAEVPAERLWSAVAAAARRAARGGPTPAGVGLGVLTPSLVLLDAQDRPVGPIRTHLDRRARQSAREVWGAVGPEFLATAGNRPLPGGVTAVVWRQMLLETPYLLHRVKSYLHVNGWLALRLTGERAFDGGNASFTGLFNTVTDRQWSQRWCDYFEVDRSWLPPVADGRATVGTLRSAAAAELGVPPGIPVKLGAADTTCAVLAAGLTADDLLHLVGTTQVVVALSPAAPRPDPQRLTRLLGVGDVYLQAVHNPVGGAALDWLRTLCFREVPEAVFYDRVIPEANGRPTRVVLDPPYLGGDRQEIEAHRGGLRELTLATDRMDLLAAVLHALVEQHGKALDRLGRGREFRRVVLSGGGAEVVRRLIPAYAGGNVEVLDEGSLRGVAGLFRE